MTGAKMTSIRVNGEDVEVAANTVAALLAELSLAPRKIAVERNLEIVPKSRYDSTQLNAGDRIEIVQFVGGG
jgi:thiamine biosynthesis protein ThiS